MNLCIDQGNSSLKLGVFKNETLMHEDQQTRIEKGYIAELIHQFKVRNCIVSSTAPVPDFVFNEIEHTGAGCLQLTHTTSLPFINMYKTPATLGKDRIAAVAGAMALKPASDILVIDAGTAITYDFLDANGVYQGGNIAPGLEMRARALHTFTHQLPLVELTSTDQFMGVDTRSAILNGIIYGAVFEIDGYIDRLLLNYPKLSVFLTGGSSFYFENLLKNRTFAVKNLVLTGLNRILNFNVQ